MLTEVRDGRVVGVKGDPDHPFTQGHLCAKVKNYQARVHSPDRLLYPMRRTGPKGVGQFARITWQAALAEIGQRFRATIAEHGAEAILPCSYMGQEGLVHGIHCGDPFFNRLGATVAERTFCNSGANAGYVMTLGPTPGVDPEAFVHARFIVLWAANTISTALHHWPFIAEAKARGATVVAIDPLRSRTAAKCDWHLPIRPGTDAALALGMIQVIVAEGLVDHAYVAAHTQGFAALAARAAEYPLERVAAITGIAVAEIRRFARAYATTQPSVIRVGVAIERSPSGGQAVQAIAALPALIGAWRHVGGGILQNPNRAFPIRREHLARPDFIRPGTRALNLMRLGRALTGELGLVPPVKALVIYNCNPAVTLPEQERVVAGLARADLFTVVHEQFITDTADYADILLPATTQLEQFDLMFSWGHYYLTANEPAIAPLGEAVSNAELFRRLARELGFNDPFFQRSDQVIAEEAMDWSAPALAGSSLGEARARGYIRLKLPAPDAGRPHAEGNFPTPSGKCEFVSSAAAAGSGVLPNFRQMYRGNQAGLAVDPLPDFVPPAEGHGRYGLSLISPKAHALLNSSYANLPVQRHLAGQQPIMIHPKDAAARGIRGGARVRIFNDRGSMSALAQVSDAVREGVVAAPLGYWRKLEAGGATVNALSSDAVGVIGGAPTFSDTGVEVAPVN
ncbi:MAG: molybdopterin oxidoreductase family protein [Alphaproteobacteria bacterium]|nr:molybdopterin oxidoreductase family protein [Alphaproteobacteria bacterium]